MENYLRKCVDSVLAQTWRNWILYLVDDQSSDGSPAICDDYAKRDSRIKVVYRPHNGGLSAARNTALEIIYKDDKTEDFYISFVDSDDYLEPDCMEFLYRLLTDTNSDISQCGRFLTGRQSIVPDGNKLEHETHILTREQAMKELCYNDLYRVRAWGKLYKAHIWRDVRFPEGYIYEDTATAHLAAQFADRIAVNMTSKYYYVQRDNSISHSREFNESKYQFVTAGDGLADFIDARYPDLKKDANVRRAFTRLSTLSQMVNANYDDPRRVREMRRVITRCAPDMICNKRTSQRDKIGTILCLMGFPVYRAVWKLYYRLTRKNKMFEVNNK